MRTISALVLILCAGVVGGTVVQFKTGVETTNTSLTQIKKSLEAYREALDKIDQILQVPVDAKKSRECVLEKIDRTRNVLAVFKRTTYIPAAASVLDDKLKKIRNSIELKTAKVPMIAEKAKEKQTKYTRKYMKKIETKALVKVNKSLDIVNKSLQGIKFIEGVIETFPSHKSNADSAAAPLVPPTKLVNAALTPASMRFAAFTRPIDDFNTQMEPLRQDANAVSRALKSACDTLTGNHVMALIDQLHDFITKDFCIDADNNCLGGNRVGPSCRRLQFGNLGGVIGGVTNGVQNGIDNVQHNVQNLNGCMELPKSCLSEVVGSLRKCMSIEDILNFELCLAVDDKCLPSPLDNYCISSVWPDRKVCTTTDFYAIAMNELKKYLPNNWDIPLPFDEPDFPDLTNVDFSALDPQFDNLDLDHLFATFPEILVNENFDGNDATQDLSNMMEAVTCPAMANSTYASACDSFLDAAFGANASMGCWTTTKIPTSFNQEALDSLCNCPQKDEIIARIDQHIKCGWEGELCDDARFTMPGQTWGSMVPGCATTFADVKAAATALEAKKVQEEQKAADRIKKENNTMDEPLATTSGSGSSVLTSSVMLVVALLQMTNICSRNTGMW